MERKLLKLVTILLMVSLYSPVKAEGWGQKLIMYIPNRVMDFLDIGSGAIGFGPKAKLEARYTRLATFGAGVGASAKLMKGANRQIGVAAEEGYNATALCFTTEKQDMYRNSRLVKKVDIEKVGINTPDERLYDFYDGARDYWAIGYSAALLLELEYNLHPVEFVDFLAGFFFIDFKADDYEYDEVFTK